jgi:16S rRNA (guanine966-N2)-methyltransferase
MPRQNNKAPSGVRPLTSQALKSLSDTLRPFIQGGKILDLFSGTGRFGLKCLEEGCESVIFIEKKFDVARRLREQNVKVICGDVFHYLKSAVEKGETFDIVFADPPFPIWDDKFTDALFTGVSQVLTEGAIFLVQHPKRVIAFRPIQGLIPWKKTQFGESIFSYFKYETGQKK